jgi:uncharacterized membrane protein HdeD (DUF308 family)
MKILQSFLLRAVCSACAGYLLVMYRTEMVRWMTIAFGALFLVSGLVSAIVYYNERRQAALSGEPQKTLMPTFPIVGAGSMILGAVLMMMPATFVTGVMYSLAAILILGAISQFVTLVNLTRHTRIPLLYWLFPTAVLLLGIYMIFRPQEMSALPFRLLGWGLMVYAAFEIVCGIKVYSTRRTLDRQLQEQQRQIEQADEVEYAEVE